MLYDARYHAAGEFVVAITLANAISIISTGHDSALLALGKSKTYLLMMGTATIGRIVGTIIGLKIFGILGMIVGIGIANLMVLTGYWAVMHKLNLLRLKIDLLALVHILVLVFIVTSL